MKSLSASDALNVLKSGEPVRDAAISGPLDLWQLSQLSPNQVLDVPVLLSGCRIEMLHAACTLFGERFALEGCTIQGFATFLFTYFLRGARMEACTFESDVIFGSGGHNASGCDFALVDTTFHGFANFCDCLYTGPFVLKKCRFDKGTNLLGNQGRWSQVRFDETCVIEDNTGKLDIDVEYDPPS